MQVFLRTVEGETIIVHARCPTLLVCAAAAVCAARCGWRHRARSRAAPSLTADARGRRENDSVQALLSSMEQHYEARVGVLARGGRRLVHGGAVLASRRRSLCDYGVRDGSTVFELSSLAGGGGDGGTTAAQRKFNVQHSWKPKVVVRDQSEEQRARFLHCAASGQPLREPIVACDLGFIYNKEEVMKQLLAKMLPSSLSHVRLKDLFEIKLEPGPEGCLDRFMCPVTQRPTNGKVPFVVVKTCGHVVSEQSLKQVGGSICVVCSAPYTKKDVVPLYPGADVVAQRRNALEEARAEEKAAREALKAAGADGKKDKRAASGGDDIATKAAKKARVEALLGGGAGSKVGQVNGALSNTITKSAKNGLGTHETRAKQDPVYASMFKKGGDPNDKNNDVAWGHGAMAGVLGGR
jgi:hypothetical protein